MQQILGGTYQILNPIGSGSGGTVYKGYHLRLQKYIVLKKIHREIRDKSREMEILKNLHHEALPQVYDFIYSAKDAFIVMDYIEGQSFKELLDRNVRFSQEQAAQFGTQLLEVLEYLHTQSIPILHGDIKPGNIILRPNGRICLIDFNISGYLTGSNYVTVGYSKGYAAPEQVRAVLRWKEERAEDGNYSTNEEVMINNTSQIIGPQADLYSVGTFLYHIVTGKRPPSDLAHLIPIKDYEGISDSFAAVVDRAMSFAPQDRFESAHQMRLALQSYTKTDSRYRRLVFRQRLTTEVLILGVALFAFLTAGGWKTMQIENRIEYDHMTEQLSEYRMSGDVDLFQEWYQECIAHSPNRSEAYIQKARFLYERREYKEMVHLIEGTALDIVEEDDEIGMGDLYYLLGNAYYELNEMDHASKAFMNAVMWNRDNPEYYRDYAISLADSGEIGEAKKTLDRAVAAGLLNDQVALVKGEIEIASGEIEAGIEDLSYCIANTDNPYAKMRAYIFSARAYDRTDATRENMIRKGEILEQAVVDLPTEQQPLVLEDLAKTYIRLQDLTDNADYTREAIRVLERVEQNRWDNVITYNNLVVLYQRLDDLSKAQAYAVKMQSLYPERYETYKRLAFLDIAIQESKTNEKRDYSDFSDHYLKAKDFAEKQLNVSIDIEMDILKDAYKQMEQEGWL